MPSAIVLVALIVLVVAFTAIAPIFTPAHYPREMARAFPRQRKHWLRTPDAEDDRRSLFKPGRRYRIKSDVSQRHARFDDGEIVTFIRADYSRFDHAYAYCFGHNDGRRDDWWLSDNEPSENSQRYFEPLL